MNNSHAAIRALPHQGSALGRSVRMALLWGSFGLGIGAMTAPPAGPLAVLSFMIAGVLVLPWLGAFLGLIGGKVLASLCGGLAGATLGLLGGVLNADVASSRLTSLGLIMGGTLGANVTAFLFWTQRVRAGLANLDSTQ